MPFKYVFEITTQFKKCQTFKFLSSPQPQRQTLHGKLVDNLFKKLSYNELNLLHLNVLCPPMHNYNNHLKITSLSLLSPLMIYQKLPPRKPYKSFWSRASQVLKEFLPSYPFRLLPQNAPQTGGLLNNRN